jgi:DNA-binding NarL/FixJ family response regulator
VLALLCEGLNNPAIAKQLFMSPKTASVHVSRILTKLGATNRTAAATAAHRLGLDQPSH